MNMRFLSIGLLLTVGAGSATAQSYILNDASATQTPGTFNISGTGIARRLVAVDTLQNNPSGIVLLGLHKHNAAWAGLRFGMGLINNETGTNGVGSNFAMWSYNDNATFRSNILFVNRETGAVGIGTTTPVSRFHVQGFGNFFNVDTVQAGINIGAASNKRWALLRRASVEGATSYGFSIYEDNTGVSGGSGARLHIAPGGRVGIGTTSPESVLQLVSSGQTIKFGSGTNSSSYAFDLGVNDDGINFNNNSTARGFNFTNGNGQLVSIAPNGNVGIAASPATGYKLSVNGSALFTKAVVKAYANWPDFVFEEDYRLQPIEEVMLFVKEHKHLPGIPSAKEVAEKGQDLGEMNAKLLQKVEELTLYIAELKAEMKKEIDTLKAEKKQ